MVSVAFAFDIQGAFDGFIGGAENTANTVEGQGIDLSSIVIILIAAFLIYRFKDMAALILIVLVAYFVIVR